MRALLFPFGSQGDVRPFVTLGLALQARGHAVTLYGNERFRRMIESAGLRCQSLGPVDEYTAVLESPDLWHPRRGPKLLHEHVFGPDLGRQLEAVKRDATLGETVVITGTFAVGAAIAAEKLGLAHVKIHGQPSAFFGAHDPPVLPSGNKMGGPLWLRRALVGLLDVTIFRSTIAKDLNAARAKEGLAPRRGNYMGSYVEADLGLCLFPEWYAARTPDWPANTHHVGFFLDAAPDGAGLSDALAAFLAAGSPPLVFTPGPGGYQHASSFFEVAAETCARLDRRGVFVTRGQAIAIASDARIHVCDYAPFPELFAASALIVHHGGIGTVGHALAAGKPQVVVPFGFDQPDNAWRLAKLGVGGSVLQSKLAASALAPVVAHLLADDEAKQRAAELGERLAAKEDEPTTRACTLIESLLA